MKAKITGTGSYIPEIVAKNQGFINNEFLNQDGSAFNNENEVIIEKFKEITGIEERRYLNEDLVNSDMALIAAQRAIDDAGVDPESLDYIIYAHNYGDVRHGTDQSDMVPSLASRVKHQLKIKNPNTIGYDVLFGCPGWILGMSQAYAYISSGMAKKVLVIGAESLSRVIDQHDRDSMIYSDGAGAVIVEQTDGESGILAQSTATFTYEEAFLIFNGESYNSQADYKTKFIKMHGRRIYNFALTHVPNAMKDCLHKAGVDIKDLKKIFIHQANEKMDAAIVQRFYGLYNLPVPEYIMPMNIHKLGNSSVATVPTLYDMVRKDQLPGYKVSEGDIIMFASVGAGMNINAMVYKI